jgi:hypothetical protein
MKSGSGNNLETTIMRMKVQVVIESDGETEVVQEIATLNRGRLQPEELGLTLAEAKGLLQGLQQTMVSQQIVELIEDNICCPSCDKPRSRKGKHEIVYRTLFGKLKLESPRYYECRCEERNKGSVSPLAELLKERTSPELIYLDWNQLPPPGPPLIVGLDGGYVHAKDQKSRTEGWFEMIVGKSAPAEDEAKCLYPFFATQPGAAFYT